ncbi:MAG: purine-nucleoside phosphorylase [Clostridiales bacterium]|nr:purine-nucleoside phosphorylase [Clostridiales bacterium]
MTDQNFSLKINEATEYISGVLPEIPDTCLVLGSGLGALTDRVEVLATISYANIPHFFKTTVPGHEGVLVYGVLSGKKTLIMKGRFHFYEGHSTQEITFYVRVMAKLGVKNLILTNAAGGINPAMKPSELMLITDHISFLCDSPLRGANLDEFGVRFPDQSCVYDKNFINIMLGCAEELGITLHQGVYAYTRGPQYETPAEIRALKAWGADAVGMSTVAEAICASHSGLRIMALSCISNLAAGISPTPLSHKEVMESALAASENSIALLERFFSKLEG